MNKTQDKFSLPAVTLSIFAAAAAERLPVCSSPRALLWQEVLAAVLLMILSALDQSVLAVRPAKACRLGSCILPAGLAGGGTGRNVLEGSASLPGRVFFAGIAGVFAAAALGGLADACPRMECPGAGVVVVCGGGKRGVSAGAGPADALGPGCLRRLRRRARHSPFRSMRNTLRYRCSAAGGSGVVSACPFSQPLYKRWQRLAWHWCSVGHTRRGNCCAHGAPGHFPGWTRRCC